MRITNIEVESHWSEQGYYFSLSWRDEDSSLARGTRKYRPVEGNTHSSLAWGNRPNTDHSRDWGHMPSAEEIAKYLGEYIRAVQLRWNEEVAENEAW